mmetsp:Transcript_49600/g.97016  ORF Transcript_49600/g.97016 Transcript_49600/m.97016 type:complete len:128 (+) Transcript_49600:361-744(+)
MCARTSLNSAGLELPRRAATPVALVNFCFGMAILDVALIEESGFASSAVPGSTNGTRSCGKGLLDPVSGNVHAQILALCAATHGISRFGKAQQIGAVLRFVYCDGRGGRGRGNKWHISRQNVRCTAL